MRDLSLHIMDIIQNSISAEADEITVEIVTDEAEGELKIRIADDGKGMDEETLNHVTDPFVTTRNTRKVGLGISLLKASAQRASGNLTIHSVKGQGTDLEAWFVISNIDRPPLGDVAETIAATIASKPEMELKLLFRSSKESFKLTTFEIKEKLGEVQINQYEVLQWIKEFINEGIKITFGGVLDEIVS